MFTGIVEVTTSVLSISSSEGLQTISRLKLAAPPQDADKIGDSISVNGCCLTIASFSPQEWTFDVSHETLSLTNLGLLRAGSRVNLERAMTMGTRLGGHLVSGHVDGLGVVASLKHRPDGWDLVLSIDSSLGKYCVKKGSITVNGVSLTINSIDDFEGKASVHLCLIPTTIAATNLNELHPGQLVNIEIDMIAKYVERLWIHRLP